MEASLNSHYATLLGLTEEWEVVDVKLDLFARKVDIFLEHRAKGVICPVCGSLVNIYDKTIERTWRHLDTMQFETLIHARIPRTKCSKDGVKNIEVPWASKNSHYTLLFEAFAIQVLQSTSKENASKLLRLSWDQIHLIMGKAVERGLARRDVSQERSFLGIDEKHIKAGQRSECFACILTDLEEKCILEVTQGRTEEAAKEVINKSLTDYQQYLVKGVALDMSAPFINAVRECCSYADIVFDKYHIMALLQRALNEIRKKEYKALPKDMRPYLKQTRSLILKAFEKCNKQEQERIEEIVKHNLETGKAWGLREAFKHFWQRSNRYFAHRYFNYWFAEVYKTQLKPLQRAASVLKRHLSNILTWFDCPIDNGLTEGFNSKIQTLITSARGFRNFNNFRIAVLFHCGKLSLFPELLPIAI